MEKIRTPSQKRLLKLQKQIFHSLEKEADELMGETPPAILQYEKSYRKDFRKLKIHSSRFRTVDHLIQSIRKSDVTWIADYHPFHQAQRTALRLMRQAIRPGEHWVIGVEMIPSHLQWALDRFQSGDLSLDSFHEAIHYRKEWGFPWKHYAPLFEWARKKRIRVLALNRPKELTHPASASKRSATQLSDLQARDQWAAGLITDYFEDALQRGYGRPRILVLYGEMHVASSHLPKQLTEISKRVLSSPLKSLSIHQNNDEIYWKLAEVGKENSVTVLEVRKDSYAVVSTTPWARLQSLINWAEGEVSQTFTDEDDFEGESGGVDYLSALSTYGKVIADFFDSPPGDLSRFSLHTIEDADFADHLKRSTLTTAQEIRLLNRLVQENERFYYPKEHLAYLGSPSFNGAAELAAVFFLREKTRDVFFLEGETFYRWVLDHAFGFLGSLVINPRRKCNLAGDFRKELKKVGYTRDQRELLKSALIWLEKDDGPIPAQAQKDRLEMWKLSRWVGYALGARVYHALVLGKIDPEVVRTHFFARAEGAHRPYVKRYEALVKALKGFRLQWDKVGRL